MFIYRHCGASLTDYIISYFQLSFKHSSQAPLQLQVPLGNEYFTSQLQVTTKVPAVFILPFSFLLDSETTHCRRNSWPASTSCVLNPDLAVSSKHFVQSQPQISSKIIMLLVTLDNVKVLMNMRTEGRKKCFLLPPLYV